MDKHCDFIKPNGQRCKGYKQYGTNYCNIHLKFLKLNSENKDGYETATDEDGNQNVEFFYSDNKNEVEPEVEQEVEPEVEQEVEPEVEPEEEPEVESEEEQEVEPEVENNFIEEKVIEKKNKRSKNNVKSISETMDNDIMKVIVDIDKFRKQNFLIPYKNFSYDGVTIQNKYNLRKGEDIYNFFYNLKK